LGAAGVLYRVNVQGTRNVLDAAVENRVWRLVSAVPSPSSVPLTLYLMAHIGRDYHFRIDKAHREWDMSRALD